MTFWSLNNVEPLRKYRFGVNGQWWFAKSVSLPSYELTTSEYQLINHKIKYPGIAEWADIELVLIDTVQDWKDGALNKKILFNNFKDSGYNLDGRNDGIKKELLKALGDTFYIVQLNAAGEEVTKWTLINPFVKAIKFGDLDYGADDMVEITITISYDSATLEKTADPK